MNKPTTVVDSQFELPIKGGGLELLWTERNSGAHNAIAWSDQRDRVIRTIWHGIESFYRGARRPVALSESRPENWSKWAETPIEQRHDEPIIECRFQLTLKPDLFREVHVTVTVTEWTTTQELLDHLWSYVAWYDSYAQRIQGKKKASPSKPDDQDMEPKQSDAPDQNEAPTPPAPTQSEMRPNSTRFITGQIENKERYATGLPGEAETMALFEAVEAWPLGVKWVQKKQEGKKGPWTANSLCLAFRAGNGRQIYVWINGNRDVEYLCDLWNMYTPGEWYNNLEKPARLTLKVKESEIPSPDMYKGKATLCVYSSENEEQNGE